MTLEELKKLIHHDLRELQMTPNTVEYASKYREATKAAYELDDYPVLAGLEHIWKLIEEDFPMLAEDRENDNYDNPVKRFMFNVDMGFYPPPEIMLSVLRCFELYYAFAGQKSLDEIFFGTPHKKKSSAAFYESQKFKYMAFHNLYTNEGMLTPKLREKSLVERAEEYLKLWTVYGEEIDPETFLRGYRRWINNWKD